MSTPPPRPGELGAALRAAELLHHRWAAPALAALADPRAAGRFAAVAHRLGIGRASLQRALGALVDAGLVRRNAGYGHPLRPEYLLTDAGRAALPWCARLAAAAAGAPELEDALLRKWTTPALLAAAAGRERFSELRDALPGATARALALALKRLEAAGLVDRSVDEGWPPRPRYRPTPRGRRIAQRVGLPPEPGSRKSAGGAS